MNNSAANKLVLPPIGFGMFDDVALDVKVTGNPVKPDPDRDAAQVEVVNSAIALGYRHFDTAEMYAGGHSEVILGRAIATHARGDFIVTSKVNGENLAYTDLLAACDRSLENLQMDYIDMYQIHWPNPDIPLQESFRALNQLVDEGKIKHIGVSNFDVPLLKQAIELSETGIASNQVYYTLLGRGPKQDGTLAFCQDHEILLTAYAPLRGGILSHSVVMEIASRINATPAQVAIQWLIRQPGVITIPHSDKKERQKENFEAANIELDDADVQLLDALEAE